ncbi:MAG: hypothetical protein H6581_24045 [Bacteroidia bacterium]|nr:hypothetical protein [Bacteroidia bacterium]
MQFKIYLLSFALLLCGILFTRVQAQSSVCSGEQICLTLNARGTIQWQQSADSATWTSASGINNDTLCLVPTTSMWYRAEVVEGTCDPIYSDPVWVEVFPGVTADAGADMNLCEGDSVQIGGSPAGSGGTGPLSYGWEPSAGLSSVTVSNPMASPNSSTSYVLTVTDSLGCSARDTMSILFYQRPMVEAGADSAIDCDSSLVLGGNPSGSGGTGSLTYSWTPGGSLNNSFAANPVASPGVTTLYWLTVTDSLGCEGMDSVLVSLAGQTTGTQTFNFTGGVQMFVVPGCVDSISMDVYGAQGGANWVNNVNYGGRVMAKFAVTPGDTLYIYVGEQPAGLTGGYNGGGNGETAGKGGGGASDVRQGGQTLNDRIIVAGGAGGGGYWSSQHVVGGLGGGLNGGDGYRSAPGTPGGQGGTQTSSGTGTCVSLNNPSMAGGFGYGGSPSGCGCEGYGGGGGWYGGAGSGNCRGGGGGSGYTAPGAANVSHNTGVNPGHGKVIFTW